MNIKSKDGYGKKLKEGAKVSSRGKRKVGYGKLNHLLQGVILRTHIW